MFKESIISNPTVESLKRIEEIAVRYIMNTGALTVKDLINDYAQIELMAGNDLRPEADRLEVIKNNIAVILEKEGINLPPVMVGGEDTSLNNFIKLLVAHQQRAETTR